MGLPVSQKKHNRVAVSNTDIPLLASESASLETGSQTARFSNPPMLLKSILNLARLGSLASCPSPSYSGSKRPHSGMGGALDCNAVTLHDR